MSSMLSFVPSPETFTVEEIPAYSPSGEGSHLFLWIEKRGLTTFDAIARIARALGVASRDVGYAGLKDRHALTRQQLSVPGADQARALEIAAPELRVLHAVPHPHKLRLGHLDGNRFEVTLTGEPGAAEREDLRARFAVAVTTGVPNRFGAQRFGQGGDNAAAGLAILRGERRERDKRRRRLLLSALQSAVFNRALELRAAAGPLAEVRAGDVLQKTDTGGLFVTSDLAVDQARVDRGEVIPTGPLPGGREIEAPPDTPARALDDAAIAAVGATREDFARAGRELPGARRAVLLKPTDATIEIPSGTDGPIRLRFTLPAGAYATVFVDALLSSGP
jgi:tRNA pseudouridine13 synthase